MPAKVIDGRYKLIKQIGAGGFGHTFIARDMRRPGSPPCVVKQLKPASDDPNFIREARRLFNTEADLAAMIKFHNCLPILRKTSSFFWCRNLWKGDRFMTN
jgi:serine/threonine protein kinase